MEKICQEARVRGRVQGVGFRAYVVLCARELSLTGSTSNQPDGTVAILACGPPSRLRDFWLLIREGPPLARVETLDIRETAQIPDGDCFEVVF